MPHYKDSDYQFGSIDFFSRIYPNIHVRLTNLREEVAMSSPFHGPQHPPAFRYSTSEIDARGRGRGRPRITDPDDLEPEPSLKSEPPEPPDPPELDSPPGESYYEEKETSPAGEIIMFVLSVVLGLVSAISMFLITGSVGVALFAWITTAYILHYIMKS